MYYSYVLQSEKDNGFYIGFTKDLKLRFEKHEKGLVESTKNRRPLKLIYYEACLSQRDATKREKYLKTYNGKRFIHNRLKSYLTGLILSENILTLCINNYELIIKKNFHCVYLSGRVSRRCLENAISSLAYLSSITSWGICSGIVAALVLGLGEYLWMSA